ncbi:MAG: hypothetical protein HON90_15865 [Halobacteriovoraceae bacterium]|jgi:hypothetical protein|nr:hypothetical protein [Halobacteriovoraceae bacterium]
MKKLLIFFLLMTSTLLFAASNSCEQRARAAQTMLEVIDDTGVRIPGIVKEQVDESRVTLADGTFCDSGFTNLQLCLAFAASLQMFPMNTPNEADQSRLNSSILSYGLLFPEVLPDRFGGCNLRLIERIQP